MSKIICVYGNFEKKDIHVKGFTKEECEGSYRFAFQNILRDAGYDAELFILDNE